MSQRLLVSVMAALVCVAAWASEPGQPLDCGDWVFSVPGLTCTLYPCDGCVIGTSNAVYTVIDNDGRFLSVESHSLTPEGHFCGTVFVNLRRFEIVARQGLQRTTLAYLDERCGNGNASDQMGGFGTDLDRISGFYYWDTQESPYWEVPPAPYSPVRSVFRFSGFTTVFDVMQSYTPQASLGFRVPYMPEGMASEDHFDTYWGDLATVGNWSQAHGLQCNYPAAQPARGEYLTVADPLPTPQPGHGYYYVTAATYQGQTRYGRKTAAGHVTGRDPAFLPACSTEVQR